MGKYKYELTVENEPLDAVDLQVCTLTGPRVSRRVFLQSSVAFRERPKMHAEALVDSLNAAFEAGRESMAHDWRKLIGVKL